ncbi:hypothetical protein HK097_004388, partial [Rhizophlyctis rosea]
MLVRLLCLSRAPLVRASQPASIFYLVPSHSRSYLTKNDRLRILKEKTLAKAVDVVKAEEAKEEAQEEKEKGGTDRSIDPNTGRKLLWFNDPFLLAEHLEWLVVKQDKADEAIDMAKRHMGSTGSEVFGRLLTALARQGLTDKVEKVVQIMSKQNKEISPQGYTSILNSYAVAPQSGLTPEDRRERIRIAEQTWDLIPTPTVHHFNAMLKVCANFVHEGGWTLARKLYTDAKDSTPLKVEDGEKPFFVPIDLITYTTMLRVCANMGGDKGYKVGMQIWKDCLQNHENEKETARRKKEDIPKRSYNRRREVNIETKKLNAPDAYTLSAILLVCARAESDEFARTGLTIASDHLGLRTNLAEDEAPEPPPQKLYTSKPKEPRHTLPFEMTNPLLHTLLQLTWRLQIPAVGFHWFRRLTNYTSFKPDVPSFNIINGLLLQLKDYEKAWKVARHSGSASPPLLLRICATAMKPYGEDNQMWFERAQTQWDIISKELADERSRGRRVDVHPILHYVDCLSNVGKWEDMSKIVERWKEDLIDQSRNMIEKSIAKKNPLLPTSTSSDSDFAALKSGATGAGSRTSFDHDLQFRLKHLGILKDGIGRAIRLARASNSPDLVRLRLLDERILDCLRLSKSGESVVRKAVISMKELRKREAEEERRSEERERRQEEMMERER